ncbi:MAG: NAD(P)-binding domain-containing protein [Planctomycetota bacterium]
MNIGIIGGGNVGSALAQRLAGSGHRVTLGLRSPDSSKAVELSQSLGADVASVPEAVARSQVVLLATPWSAAEDAVRACGDLSGKVVIDCTNPLRPDLSGLVVDGSASGAERIASWAEGAHVVKMFNTTGAENMRRPDYGGTALTMLYAGDHPGANEVAEELARSVGFAPIRVGPLSMAGALESFALTWITLAYSAGVGPDFAFQLVPRPGN